MGKPQDPRVHIGKAARLVMTELGLDQDTVMRRAGLPPSLLDGAGHKVSLDQYYDLWASVTQDANMPTLALILGDASGIDYFDPAFFAAMCSPNMNVAVARLADYKRRVSPFTLDVVVTADTTQIAFQCRAHPAIHPTLALTEIVFLTNFARRATRHRITPRAVHMPFDVPDPAAYEAHFGCAVRRGARASITLDAADATRPFVTHNDEMWALFEPKLRRQIADADTNVAIRSKVVHCLNEFLPSGRTSVGEVARELAMSKRTLQRRLADEGTTWLEVLNEAREMLAKHYLTATDYGTTEVSFLLGFEDPNSFFRAFRRWEHTTPELWREQHRPPATALH